jgi:hypothetical protein
MKLPVSALRAGDTIRLNDWTLHILAVDRDARTGVLIAELSFAVHFDHHDRIEVIDRAKQPATAA